MSPIVEEECSKERNGRKTNFKLMHQSLMACSWLVQSSQQWQGKKKGLDFAFDESIL